MKKLLTILLLFGFYLAIGQTGEIKPITAKVLQTPNNATFSFNPPDTTVRIHMGAYGIMKLAGAKKTRWQLDSLAASATSLFKLKSDSTGAAGYARRDRLASELAKKAPISGSVNYVWNQNSTYQNASLKIAGGANIGTFIRAPKIALSEETDVDINGSVWYGLTNRGSSGIDFNGYYGINFNTSFGNVLKLQQNGAAIFASTVDATGYKLSGVSTFLDWSRTGYAGTSGQYLKSQGISTTPIWTDFGSTKMTYGSAFTFSNDRDIVDKAYVDAVATGNLPKTPVEVATTANITLSGAQTIDTYSAVAGNRVLVWNQSTPSQNGIYVVASGAWSRATDTDTWAELYKSYVAVINGSQSGSSFVCTIPSSGTLETTDVTWVLYNLPTNIVAGTGLTKTGNTISLNTASAGGLGGIKIGSGITMTGDVASVSTDYSPASGSANYVQIQNASAQSGNMWISGNATANYTRTFGQQLSVGGFAASNLRWDIKPDGSETGSDAGSDYVIFRYSDIGNYLGRGLKIERSTGNTNFYGTIDATGYKLSGVSTFLNKFRTGYMGASGQIPIATGISADFDWVTPTTAHIAASTNKNYVTDAQQTVITNTSGTNSGDNAVNTLYSGLVTNATHTGEVTGATALTIANDAVTNAKLANVATSTIKGRVTAATGDPEDLTATQVRTLLNVADGANAYIHPNHSGDVTSVADGAQTIAANAVTNAKAAQMATKTYKGRTTAGTGNSEDVPVATLKTDLGLVKGDVGLGNVDNTSDVNKPVSTATQTALNLKQNSLSGTGFVKSTAGTISYDNSTYDNYGSWALYANGADGTGVYSTGVVNMIAGTNMTISKTGNALTFNSTGGGGMVYPGAGIPLSTGSAWGTSITNNSINWDAAYTNRITSLTTTGNSGASTLVTNTLNIPNYTLAGLGGIGLTSLSSTATGLTYTNTTGVFSLTSGYVIPTTTEQTNWGTAYSNMGKVKNGLAYGEMNTTQFYELEGNIWLTTTETATNGSSTPFTSGGAYTALALKANLTGAAFTGAVTNTSTFTATNFILSSDRRLKQNINPIEFNPSRKIDLIQYRMKSDPTKLRYGVVAQQVKKYMPELVYEDEKGMLSVSYLDLLIAKIADLENRIKKLENENKK